MEKECLFFLLYFCLSSPLSYYYLMRVMCLNNPLPARRYKSDIVCIFRVRFLLVASDDSSVQLYYHHTVCVCVCVWRCDFFSLVFVGCVNDSSPFDCGKIYYLFFFPYFTSTQQVPFFVYYIKPCSVIFLLVKQLIFSRRDLIDSKISKR